MSNPFYTKTGNPQAQTRGLSSQIRNEFTLIEQGFDGVAPTNSPAFTGTPTAPMPGGGTWSQIATVQYVMEASLSGQIPGQTGNAGKFLKTDGATAGWAGITGYSARTSNTQLGVSDLGKLIDITSGTFSQTFDACASLGNSWFCYVRNSGAGDITLEPNGAETIDALTNFIMYPGEMRVIFSTGTELVSCVLMGFVRDFTATGTFTKPPGYKRFQGLLWGAGGSGAKGATIFGGGGGGACLPFDLPASAIGATQAVTIGAGGEARTTAIAGAIGGNSTFASLTAYGGGGGGSTTGKPGGGGGVLGAAHHSGQGTGGFPFVDWSKADDASFGGGNTATSQTGNSVYGGAGGVTGNGAPYVYGRSIYGGGGGGGSTASVLTGGISLFGGNGGNGSGAGSATAGAQPGGGGGGTNTGASSGAGGDGMLRIWGCI